MSRMLDFIERTAVIFCLNCEVRECKQENGEMNFAMRDQSAEHQRGCTAEQWLF